MERIRLGDTLKRMFSRGEKPQDLPDITAEQVKARREANAIKHESIGNYEVKQELVIPTKFYTGKAPLVTLAVIARSPGSGKMWNVTATLFSTPGELIKDERSQPVFGKITYEGDKINTKEALKIADEWVRDSAVWVPHEKEIPFPDYMATFAGCTLYEVRGN